jgi:hypothetical protein
MAYGYIKGAEITALSYYEALLGQMQDSEERKKIQGMISDLKETLAEKQTQLAGEALSANRTVVGTNFACSLPAA